MKIDECETGEVVQRKHKKIVRKRDVKLRRHCPLCGTNLEIFSDDVEVDFSYVALPLRCPQCSHREHAQIFLNVDFNPVNERVEFEKPVESEYRFP